VRRGTDPREGGLLWGGRWQWVLEAMGGIVVPGQTRGTEVDIREALVG